MTDTHHLLTEYRQTGSDAAFRELVSRYVDLVYSTALRLLEGDAHRAQDVAQTVFVNLAHKARTLPEDVSLGGWLHRDTCLAAGHVLRGERRRQSRERQAAEMNALQNHSDADYSHVAPLLDEAINELGEADRTAILLRFFEQHDFRAVGQALGGNEDAARMRVNRALEKLEEFLKRRGITTTAASLGVVLTANAVQAAPVGLALTISAAAAITGTTLATTATITTTKAIAMTTLQKTIITATLAVLAGAGIYEARQASQLREQVQTLQRQQTPLVEQIAQLQNERDDSVRQLAGVQKGNEHLKSNTNISELLRLRGEVGVLRQTANELEKLRQDERLAFSVDDIFKVKQLYATDTMNTLMGAVKQFATSHGGNHPKSFDELKASVDIPLTNFQGNLSFDDFMFLDPDTKDFQGTLLILRNRSPIEDPKGNFFWVYGSLRDGTPSSIATTARYGN